MSEHKTFFGKIFAAIVTAWTIITGSEKKLEDLIKNHTSDGIYYAQILMNLLRGQWVDIIKVFTPDNVDGVIDEKRAWALEVLDEAIKKIYKGRPCLDLPTLAERVSCLINELKNSPISEELKNKNILAIASKYVQIGAEKADGLKVKERMADTAVMLTLEKNQIDLNEAA